MSAWRFLAGAVASSLLVVAACAGPAGVSVESPKEERMPPPQTSDGRVVGADDKSPSKTLAEQGTTAHPAPGWKIGPNGVSYDPKREPAGSTESGTTNLAQPDAGARPAPAGK